MTQFTGLEPPADRQCRTVFHFTDAEFAMVGDAVLHESLAEVSGPCPIEQCVAEICRQWLESKNANPISIEENEPCLKAN